MSQSHRDEPERIRVLHVEDDGDFAAMADRYIERENERISVDALDDPGAALTRLAEEEYDCVVSDYEMPGMDGIELLRRVRDRFDDLPYILYTARGSEAVASEAVSAGVTDYMQKERSTDQYAILAKRIENVVERYRSERELAERTREQETLISNLPGMVYRCTNETGWPMESVAGDVEDLTGYTAAALESEDVVWGEDILHPDDRAEMWEAVQEALADGDSFEVTYRIRTKDGEIRWMWERGRKLEDGMDGPAVIEGFITDITERREQARTLRAIVENTDNPIYIKDRDGTYQFANEATADVFGLDPDEVVGRTDADLFDPESAAKIRAADERIIETGESVSDERVTTVDGERHVFLTNKYPYRNEAGEIVGMMGISQEISERRRQVEAMDTSMDGMAILDPDGRYTYVNEAHAEVYGYDDTDAFLGETWRMCYGEDELERFEEEVMPTLYERGEWRGRAVGRRAGGERFDQRLSLTALDNGGIVCVVRDISDQIRREQRLTERQAAMRRAYEVITDTDREFRAQVRALLEVVQDVVETDYATFSRIEDSKYVFEAVISPDDVTLEAGDTAPLDTLPNCEHVVETEETLVMRDVAAEAPEFVDSTWGISCYLGAPVLTEDGVYGTFCFYDVEARSEDFSDWAVTFVDLLSNWVSSEIVRRRALERVQQQNEQLEEFASIVSHDLRNPLNVLSGALELAESTGNSEHFEQCRRSMDRMETLIDQLLTLAQAGERITDTESVDLATVAGKSWAAVDTEGASLQIDVDNTVEADPKRLRQLFENLFRNAVEHSSTSPSSQAQGDAVGHGTADSPTAAADGSTTTSGVGEKNGETAEEHDPADPQSRTSENAVVQTGTEVTVRVGACPGGFFVADDGPGIPEDERDVVFDPGYSTTDDGTGLGLQIVAEVAESHGWEVTVTESADGGARFECTGFDG